MDHVDDTAAFRRWLVEKLKQGRWIVRRAEPIEATAMRLGVQPDLIEQAQREMDEAALEAGRLPVEVGSHATYANKARKFFDLDFPKDVYADWRRYCAARRTLSQAAMMRSIIHTLLSGPAKPAWTGRGWMYRGRVVKMEGYGDCLKQHKRWPYHVHCDITHGARTALTWRAESYGASVTGLVRGAVTDVLEGRTQRLLVAHGVAVMWDDPYRYWVSPEKK